MKSQAVHASPFAACPQRLLSLAPIGVSLSLSLILSLGLSSGLASAQTTYVVDDDGGFGVDFTDIDSALAVAGSVDVIEVRAGVYAPFTMTSPTRLLGDPGARVNAESRIVGVAAGAWTVVAGLEMDQLHIEDTPGTVILDDINLLLNRSSLVVENSADVRGRDVRNQPSAGPLGTLLRVDASNVQLADSSFICPDAPNETDGSTAALLTSGSYLHLTDCNVQGGRGGDFLPLLFSYVGRGGAGIQAADSSTVRLVRSEVRGGGGGLGDLNVYFDAPAGNGFNACGGTQEVWASTVEGGFTLGSVVPPGNAFAMGCGAILSDQLPLPSLESVGPAIQGTALTLEVHAAPLSSGRLIFGRFPVRVEIPGSAAPRLVDVGRLASLGAMAPGGSSSLQLGSSVWPRGTVVFLQTSQTVGAGTQMANSVAVVVR
jgi:hypothetical protein